MRPTVSSAAAGEKRPLDEVDRLKRLPLFDTNFLDSLPIRPRVVLILTCELDRVLILVLLVVA